MITWTCDANIAFYNNINNNFDSHATKKIILVSQNVS